MICRLIQNFSPCGRLESGWGFGCCWDRLREAAGRSGWRRGREIRVGEDGGVGSVTCTGLEISLRSLEEVIQLREEPASEARLGMSPIPPLVERCRLTELHARHIPFCAD